MTIESIIDFAYFCTLFTTNFGVYNFSPLKSRVCWQQALLQFSGDLAKEFRMTNSQIVWWDLNRTFCRAGFLCKYSRRRLKRKSFSNVWFFTFEGYDKAQPDVKNYFYKKHILSWRPPVKLIFLSPYRHFRQFSSHIHNFKLIVSVTLWAFKAKFKAYSIISLAWEATGEMAPI